MTKPPVLVIAAVQLVLVSLAAAVLHFYGRPVSALSVFLGGALCALPNAYFGLRAFRESGARAADRVLQNFYRGEVGKFVLTLTGFAVVFASIKPLNPAAVFISYGLCVILQWLLAARLVR
ncbi:ATP synthase subunit I [Microbulbifer thermotolerans]|uniref:ATP F0F1 synthase subunit I n=1 Tax=Microbulbifer thermotolerans TaxID=252514 RepID=A0A143HQC6_MICTH|nr:ATP synthase subunit I [Microbulbifer thermotolerans]AMX03934.1 ATP F0F1 synthase subunit I [Microbulbifer thermotolerans]MCX2778538.1 ATP synthase subunit I [Microbulbifer thermotolerans]MCX2782907.1 ATP synthase subunit I [Microbulbifer thermotolerans]MCX2794022.1 ATP synthase subunit I [Microbulbifer thermotolerans]MCX2801726.1 ATP synthase subunit I [Microbulbifer thermotolerans]